MQLGAYNGGPGTLPPVPKRQSSGRGRGGSTLKRPQVSHAGGSNTTNEHETRRNHNSTAGLLQDESRLQETRGSRSSARRHMGNRIVYSRTTNVDDQFPEEGANRRRSERNPLNGSGYDGAGDELKGAIDESRRSVAGRVRQAEDNDLPETPLLYHHLVTSEAPTRTFIKDGKFDVSIVSNALSFLTPDGTRKEKIQVSRILLRVRRIYSVDSGCWDISNFNNCSQFCQIYRHHYPLSPNTETYTIVN